MPRKNIDHWKKALTMLPEPYQLWLIKERETFTTNIQPNSSVLEVGCGDGRVLRYLTPITTNLIGVDHDQEAIQSTRDALELKLVLAEGKALPFSDESFDYVLCIGTFSNLASEKYDVLVEMKRVINRKGSIFVSCYSEDALPARLELYRKNGSQIKEVKGDGTVIFDESMGDNISEQFSREQLLDIFRKAELKPEIIKEGIGYICRLVR